MGLFKSIASVVNPVLDVAGINLITGGNAGKAVNNAAGFLDQAGNKVLGFPEQMTKIHPQLSLINKVGYNPNVMANQNDLIAMMKRRAEGQDSLAAAQAQATGQQNLNQALAQAASARGVNPNMAFRSAQLQGGDMAAQTAQNAMLGRLAEMQQAGQLYNQAIGQQASYTSELDRLRAQQEIAQLEAATQTQLGQYQGLTGILSGMAGGAGAGLMSYATKGVPALPAATSDENLKKNISYDEKGVNEMFKNLKSATYEYKNEKDGKGKYAGVMAQDLEKSKVGNDMVMDTPEGKKVDLAKMIFALTAQVNNMNKKLEKIKG